MIPVTLATATRRRARHERGPVKASAAVDDAARVALEHDLLALANQYNTSSTGTLRVPRDYLEVVAVKAG